MNLKNIHTNKFNLNGDITLTFEFSNRWTRSMDIREGMNANDLQYLLTMVGREMVHDEYDQLNAPTIPPWKWVAKDDKGSQVMEFV